MSARRPRGRATAVVAGRRAVAEAVRSGAARDVLVADSARSTEGMREVLEAADGAAVPVERVPVARIRELAGTENHQGVVARVRMPPTLGEPDLGRRGWDDDAVVVALDGITDPHNLGAIARSAEAAGASALVVRARRGAAVGATAVKASAGALLHLRVAEVANVSRALERLKGAGFWIVGLAADAPTSVLDAERQPGRLALVIGSEGAGLSRLVRRNCDEVLSIPLRGRVRSLNASAAAAIALFGYAARPIRTGHPKRAG